MKFWLCAAGIFTSLCLIHTQQLQNVPSTLSELAAGLHYDKDIQAHVNSLAHDGQKVAGSFKQIFQNDLSKLLTEKNRLVKVNNPADVKVDTLKQTLKSARNSLSSERKNVVTLQADIHSTIETCRGRKTEHDTKRQNTIYRVDTLTKEITSLNENIKSHEESVGTLDQSARDLDAQANNLRNAADEKEDDGIFGGILVGIIGGALAPFTGGASLAVATALAGVHVGVNLNDADDCNRNADRLRVEATSKRAQAQNIKSQRDALLVEKQAIESQIRALQTSSDELGKATSRLQEVSGYLLSSIDVIDRFHEAVEDMDTAIKDAELQSDSFRIIQNAFASNPATLNAKSQGYLDKLKGKWNNLEQILIHHGAKARLT